MENEDYTRQSNQIISRNGCCPFNTQCFECVYVLFNKTATGCNADTAIQSAKQYLEKQKETK
jgi:hypothetical protein